jgi:small subunit ribosomal protein S1
MLIIIDENIIIGATLRKKSFNFSVITATIFFKVGTRKGGISITNEQVLVTFLTKALEKQIILEAPVTMCDHSLNLHVELGGGVMGIIPRDEVLYTAGNEPVKDIAILTRVGKPVCFKVCGFKKDCGSQTVAILSRRSAQRECVENYICTLCPGDIIPTRVTHLESFGAFVDVGCGIISLLSIDCISVSRISHPSMRLSPGDYIFTVVKGKDELGRISVSLRELLGSQNHT